jgi:hypothetical protein
MRITREWSAGSGTACAWLAIASAVGIAGTSAIPVANADPLDPIRAAANNARSQTSCPPLNYNRDLEGQAQHAAENTEDGVPPFGQYKGTFIVLQASGDHEDKQIGRVVNDPVSKLSFKDCGYKDFGVGFKRFDNTENDFVVIVLGKPDAPDAVQPPQPVDPPKPVEAAKPIPCPDGSEVPAGQTCPAEPAPTDAVTMNLNRSGLTNVTATFANSSKVSGICHYDAEDVNGILPGKTDDFSIGAKATVTRTYPAPPILSTYHAVVSCTGNFNGQNIEFGHAEQDVSG